MREKLEGFPGYERQVEPDGPHGWIQWKGTEVCMDIRCGCGYVSHIDAEFAYFVKCPACKQVYNVDPHVRLIPLDADEVTVQEPCMDDSPVEYEDEVTATHE